MGQRLEFPVLLCGALVTSLPGGFAQSSTLDRPSAPVVLTGQNLPTLVSVPPTNIVTFRHQGGWEQMPVQVDECRMSNFGVIEMRIRADFGPAAEAILTQPHGATAWGYGLSWPQISRERGNKESCAEPSGQSQGQPEPGCRAATERRQWLSWPGRKPSPPLRRTPQQPRLGKGEANTVACFRPHEKVAEVECQESSGCTLTWA